MTKADLKARIQQALQTAPYRAEIRRIALFGSHAYGTPRPDSDVDILIEFEPSARVTLLDMARLENYFSHHLEHKVDLRTPAELSRFFRTDTLNKSEPVYER